MQTLRAMILSAGLGSRMEQAGEPLPKPLVQVLGKPLIHYPLMLIARAGFKEVIINLFHRADEIKSTIGQKAFGVKINWLIEPQLLGTGGGIKNAQKLYPAKRWLVLNADTIIDIDLKELVNFHQKFSPLATMVLSQVRLRKYTPILVDELGWVKKIGTEPQEVKRSPNMYEVCYCGVQVVESRLLDFLPEGKSQIIEQAYIPALRSKEKILGHFLMGFWIAIDDPEAKERAERELGAKIKAVFKA